MRTRIVGVTALVCAGFLGAAAPVLASPSVAQAAFYAPVPSTATDPWAVISNTWVINNRANLGTTGQYDVDGLEAWMRDGTGYIFGGEREALTTSGYEAAFFACAMTTDGTQHCQYAMDPTQYYGDQIANALQRSSSGNGSSWWENVLWIQGVAAYTFGPWQIYGSQAGAGQPYEQSYIADSSGGACEPVVVQGSWINFRYNDTDGGNGFPSAPDNSTYDCDKGGHTLDAPTWGSQAYGWINFN